MFYEKFYWMMPKFYRKWLKEKLIHAGMDTRPEKYGGMSLCFSFTMALVLFTGALFFDFEPKIAGLIGLGGLVVLQFLSFKSVLTAVEKRTKKTEEILPDSLILMSSNIKSGLTPDRALLLSAREEFGPLGEEIKKAAKRVIAGRTLQEAIREIPKAIESRILERTINLLQEGIKQGGSLVNLLETLANDIRQTKILRKEIKSYVLMYVIFIFFAVGIGAPVLFAISSYLVKTMSEMSTVLDVDSVGRVGGMRAINFKAVNVDLSFLTLYSVLALSVNSIFGGILIGIVQEGTGKGGLKYIPVLMGISLGIYFVTRTVVTNAMSIF